MMKWKGTACLLVAVIVAPMAAHSQSADTTRKFSVFGGVAASNFDVGSTKLFPEVAFGGSGDFRVNAFPLTLRTTVAFSQASSTFLFSDRRYGTLSLDGVAHLGKGILGLHPYLLGGVGVATAAPYRLFLPAYSVVDNQVVLTADSREVTLRRTNWAFVEGGGGLEFGKFFLEGKIQQPAAMSGLTRKPVSFGIRF